MRTVSEEENYSFPEEDNTVHEERLFYKRKFIVKLRTEFKVKLMHIIFYCTILFSTFNYKS